MKRQALLVLLLTVALLVAACGPTVSGPKIRVENVWGRPSPKIATAGAFYMTIYEVRRQRLMSRYTSCAESALGDRRALDRGLIEARQVSFGPRLYMGSPCQAQP